MSSETFLMRFKNKFSTLNRTGEVNLTLSKPVELPKLMNLSPQFLRVKTVDLTRTEEKSRKRSSARHRRDVSPGRYLPCTLEEFKTFAQPSYWQLGSLGPSRIGTQTWESEHRSAKRKAAYGRAVRLAHSTGRSRPVPLD